MLEPAQGKKEIFFPFYFLFGHIINNLLTELGQSVWENLDLDRWYRPLCVRSILATSVKILPYRPPARLIRTEFVYIDLDILRAVAPWHSRHPRGPPKWPPSGIFLMKFVKITKNMGILRNATHCANFMLFRAFSVLFLENLQKT